MYGVVFIVGCWYEVGFGLLYREMFSERIGIWFGFRIESEEDGGKAF